MNSLKIPIMSRYADDAINRTNSQSRRILWIINVVCKYRRKKTDSTIKSINSKNNYTQSHQSFPVALHVYNLGYIHP